MTLQSYATASPLSKLECDDYKYSSNKLDDKIQKVNIKLNITENYVIIRAGKVSTANKPATTNNKKWTKINLSNGYILLGIEGRSKFLMGKYKLLTVSRKRKLRLSDEYQRIDSNSCNNLFKYEKAESRLVHKNTNRGIFCDENNVETTCDSRPAEKVHFV